MVISPPSHPGLLSLLKLFPLPGRLSPAVQVLVIHPGWLSTTSPQCELITPSLGHFVFYDVYFVKDISHSNTGAHTLSNNRLLLLPLIPVSSSASLPLTPWWHFVSYNVYFVFSSEI